MLAEKKLMLPLVTLENAEGPTREKLASAKSAIGFVPNMYAAMANAPSVLSTYLHGYAAFRSETLFNATEQEVVFLTISRNNGCAYCLAAHSMVADMSGVPGEVTDAIRNGAPIADGKLEALRRFTDVMVTNRGLPSAAELDAFLAAGYGERQVLEIITAIAVKTLSNYTNHLFHTELDPAFAGRTWAG